MKKSLVVAFFSMLITCKLLGVELAVPYYYQSGSAWCWAGSAAMVGAYYQNPSSRQANVKIWEAAAYRNAPYDDSLLVGHPWDITAVLGEWLTDVNFSWTDVVSDNAYIKSKILERVAKGHPVIMCSWDNAVGNHAFVVVGADDNFIYINDPSGALFAKTIHSQTPWDDFFDKIDTSWWIGGDGFLIYSESTASFNGWGGVCSFDFLPDCITGYAAPGDMIASTWDGDLYDSGYSWACMGLRETSSHPSNGAPHYDNAKFLAKDEIILTPHLAAYTTNSALVDFEATIWNQGHAVWTTSATSISLSASTQETLNDVPSVFIKKFANQLSIPECTLIATCRDTVSKKLQDRLELEFSIFLETAIVGVESSPSGVSISIDQPDRSGDASGTAPFSRTFVKDSEIVLTAPSSVSGWAFKEWQKGGVTYSTANGVALTITDAMTMKAVYQVLDSDILVAGSTAPAAVEKSAGPGNGWTFNIPVQNRKTSSVTVNVTKSGNAKDWVTLTGGTSFTLAGSEIKQYQALISIPSSTSAGTYTATILFNGIAQDFIFTVYALERENEIPLQSGSVSVDARWTSTSFAVEDYGLSPYNISGTSGNSTWPTFTLSSTQALNADYFYFIVNVEKLAASSSQNLNVFLNGKLFGTQASSGLSSGSIATLTCSSLNGCIWTSLIGNGNSYNNTLSFKPSSWTSGNSTVLWQVNPYAADLQFVMRKTANAWKSGSTDIANNLWNRIQDDFLVYARVYAHVDSVTVSGKLDLYCNNELVGSKSVSSTGDIYWTVSESDLAQDDNVFVIKGQTSGSGSSGSGTVVQLSNIHLILKYDNEIPDLQLTKTITPNPLLVGQQATVKVTLSNPTEYSTTGNDTSLMDASLPTGLTLVSGSLSDSSFGERVEEGDSEEHSYVISASAVGYYTLGSANFAYETIDGDDRQLESDPVVLEVRGGGLTVTPTFTRRDLTGSTIIDCVAQVSATTGGANMPDASVVGEIYKQVSGNWTLLGSAFSLGYDPSLGEYRSTSPSVSAAGDYKCVIKAQRAFYDNGTSSEYTFSIVAPATYTVSYSANGATGGSAPSSQTKTNDVNLTLQTNSGDLTKTGYTFSGWNTQLDGNGADYAVGGTYTENADITLYAKWMANTSGSPLFEYEDRQTVAAGVPYTTAPTIQQGDPSTMVWSFLDSDVPTGMTIDPRTGIVTWSDPQPVGQTFNLCVKAENEWGWEIDGWELTITDDDNNAVHVEGNAMWNRYAYFSWRNITAVYQPDSNNAVIDTWKVDDNGNGDPRDDESRILLNGQTDTPNGLQFYADDGGLSSAHTGWSVQAYTNSAGEGVVEFFKTDGEPDESVKSQLIGHWTNDVVSGLLSTGFIHQGTLSLTFSNLLTDATFNTGFDADGVIYANNLDGSWYPIGVIDYVTGRFDLDLGYYAGSVVTEPPDSFDIEGSCVQINYALQTVNGDSAFARYTLKPDSGNLYGELTYSTVDERHVLHWGIEMINSVWVRSNPGEMSLYNRGYLNGNEFMARDIALRQEPVVGEDFLISSNVTHGVAALCSDTKAWTNVFELTSASSPIALYNELRTASEFGGWPFCRWAEAKTQLPAGTQITLRAVFKSALPQTDITTNAWDNFWLWENALLERTWLSDMLIAAHDGFSTTIQQTPDDIEARIYRAVTTLAKLAENENLHMLFEDFGGSLDMAGLVSSFVFGGTNAPPSNEAVDRAAAELLPALDAALADLNAVPDDWGGTVEIAAEDSGFDETVYVDLADVLLAKSALYAVCASVGIAQAYDLTTDYGTINPWPCPLLEVTPDGNETEWADVQPLRRDYNWPVLYAKAAQSTDGQLFILIKMDDYTLSQDDTIFLSLAQQSHLDNGSSNNSINMSFGWDAPLQKWVGEKVWNGTIEAQCAVSNGIIEIALSEFEQDDIMQTRPADIIDKIDYIQIRFPYWWMTCCNKSHYSADAIRQTIEANPDLLRTVRAPETLSLAKENLRLALVHAQTADRSITGRTDATWHFFEISPEQTNVLSEMRQRLQEVLSSLDTPQAMSACVTNTECVYAPPSFVVQTQIIDRTENVYLGAFFEAPYLTRQLLPRMTSYNEVVLGSFPDATFGGIFPDWIQESETNLIGRVPVIKERAFKMGEQWFNTGGYALWSHADIIGWGGIALSGAARRSGKVSWAETTVAGPGTMDFSWTLLASENQCARLSVYIDGVCQGDDILSDTGWVPRQLEIPSGRHTVRWTYTQYENVAEDADSMLPLGLLADLAWDQERDSTSNTPTPVPYVWLDGYPELFVGTGDYEDAALADQDDDGQATWEEYVAGTDPTDPASIFLALIEKTSAGLEIGWTPDMRPDRVYSVEGKADLREAEWGPTNAASRFFRVKVELP